MALSVSGLDLERFDREMAGGIYTRQVLEDYHNSMVNGITRRRGINRSRESHPEIESSITARHVGVLVARHRISV